MKEKSIRIGIFELSIESEKVRIHLDQKEENKTTENTSKIKKDGKNKLEKDIF